MPFLENDLYLYRDTTGNNKIVRGDWTSTVYKYDASSFYNWEQDNLPLYDLDERTELNWEQTGYAASSIDGVQLVVSDTGADTAPPYQVFDSVSAALEKLPKVLRFPVIIEVAASGDLGNIDVEDFEFLGPDAGLEIVNRGFGKILCGSSIDNWDMDLSGLSNQGNISAIGYVSSLDLSNTLTDSSSLVLSTTVAESHTGGNFWNDYNRSIIRMSDVYSTGNQANPNAYGTAGNDKPSGYVANNGLTVNIKNVGVDTALGGFQEGISNRFKFAPYTETVSGSDYNANPDLNVKALRNSSTADLSGSEGAGNGTGFIYANSAGRIRVKNCNGPLYIRGFVVDGYRGTNDPLLEGGVVSHTTKHGIEVENSNVVIENCAAIRCGSTGLRITNSDVTLNRGFTAYRIYPLADDIKGQEIAYGMQANNSQITLSAAYDISRGLPGDAPFSFAYSPVGVQLNDSILKTPQGGRGVTLSGEGEALAAAVPYWQIYLDTFLNTKTGLEANNSFIDFNHTLMSYMNEVGIQLNNTTLKADEIVCDHNNRFGIRGENSTIEYYKNMRGNSTSPNKVLSLIFNGQHLNLTNCIFKNKEIKSYSSSAINNFEIGAGGYSLQNGISVPGVSLKNTEAHFLEMRTTSGAHVGLGMVKGKPYLGVSYYIDDGSDVKFLGTSGNSYCTMIEGAGGDQTTNSLATYDALIDSVAVFVDNNSKVEFNGPTIMNRAGINVGADNNSTIRFAAHNKDGVLDIDSFALSDGSQHTRVELQSFKSCLVANNNSTIEFKDCGSFNDAWNRTGTRPLTSALPASSLIANSDYNPANIDGTLTYTSGGYIQFYPNPILRDIAGVTAFSCSDSAATNRVNALNPLGWMDGNNIPSGGTKTDWYDRSWGGMCLRADKGSEVNVLNTHFPCGFENPSSTILDVSAGSPLANACGKVFIWNIADDSRLNASHISISGHYPGDSGVIYHGPSGFYVSAAGCNDGTFTPLSSAPSATHNTGRLSILDSFGLHDAVAADAATGASALEARSSFDNKGPFRIYFSVHPIAKYLGYTAGVDDSFQLSSNLDQLYFWPDGTEPSAVRAGEPYQELSQGYNPSRDCSTTDPHVVSAIYNELGFQGLAAAGGQPLSTTFFYASGMLDGSYVNRIWLDDSAMNVFANAKNATKGTSGRVKLVSYYRATTNQYGSSYAGDAGNTGGFRNGYGLGFRSSNIFDFDRNT